MLLATGVVALSRKVADEREKKKQERQGRLTIGDSDVAKRAFHTQTSKMLEAGDGGIKRAGTNLKYQDPSDVSAGSPDTASPTIYSPKPEIRDARKTSQLDVTSPVNSEKGTFQPNSPAEETPTSQVDFTNRTPRSTISSQPPPYSARPQSSVSALSPSGYSRDSDQTTSASSDTGSLVSFSVNSQGTHSIRVKTKGSDLKSGFPYHPALFDLHVAPDKWDNFTHQLVESVKFGSGDYARMWGAATATAMTGAIGTSIFVGRSMNRSLQEKKVKAGLTDSSVGGLGDLLTQWNDEYFNKQGLFARLELSESAMKNPEMKNKTFRKPASFYSNRDDRENKKEERKFVIVVSKLDEDLQPSGSGRTLAGTDVAPVEIGSSGETSDVVELPAGEAAMAVELPAEAVFELPAEMPSSTEKRLEPPRGYVEMDSDNTLLMEKLQLDEEADCSPADSDRDITPKPLMTNADSYASINKEMM